MSRYGDLPMATNNTQLDGIEGLLEEILVTLVSIQRAVENTDDGIDAIRRDTSSIDTNVSSIDSGVTNIEQRR